MSDNGVIQFDSMAELKGRLSIDSEDEFNVDHLIYLKRNVYENTDVTLQHVPINFVKRQYKCSNGHDFVPDWLEKRPPNSPVRGDGGFLKAQSEQAFCPLCNQPVTIEIPSHPVKGEVTFFGDEAVRHVNGKTYAVYTFSVFNGPRNRKKRFLRKLNKIKSKMCPNLDPMDWQIHMTDLLDRKKRSRSPEYRHLSDESVQHYIMEICNEIRRETLSNDITVDCSISRLNNENPSKSQIQDLKSDAFYSAACRLIYDSTNQGWIPRIVFEKTGKDGWSMDFFKSSRLTLFWTFLTHSIQVPSPIFVKPSYHPLLEISDIVSYIIARHIFEWEKVMPGARATPRFPTKLLGRVSYQITMNNGDWQQYIFEDLPIKVIQNGSKREDCTNRFPDMYFVKVK